MKILMITRKVWPHIGGVERHIAEVSKVLERKGNKVKIISEGDINYPHIKFLGLLFIWFWFFKNRKLIKNADVIHIHDVFIWYLPFRVLYPKKRIVTTIHGLEWGNPLNKISLWQKWLAVNLSGKSVGVGDFLEKYIKAKFDLIIYGAVSRRQFMGTKRKQKNRIVFVGRLEKDTGVSAFLKWFKKQSSFEVYFCGDGSLRSECEKYGTVLGFCDPAPFYRSAKYCVPGGYLAALEAVNSGCELKPFWDSIIKKDYWNMSPFVQPDIESWARRQTWEKMADEYLALYNNIE